MWEVLATFHWSGEALAAFQEAFAEYRRAGCPPMRHNAQDFRAQWNAMSPDERQSYLFHSGRFTTTADQEV
jgi:hypothetical protein